MWITREIPLELGWTILVLIPKENTYNHDIGLLETHWKVLDAIINTPLQASIQFSYVLYGF